MTRALAKFRAADFWSALLSSYSFIGISVLLQIGLVPFYLQHLGKSEFGLLMILLSAINFLTFGIHGLTGNVLRALTHHASSGDVGSFSRSYSRARLLFGLYTVAAAAAASLLFFALHISNDASLSTSHAILLSVGFAAGQLILNADLGVVRLALSALQRQAAANLFQIVGLLAFAALVVPLLYSGSGLNGVLGALFAGNLIARLSAGIYIKRAAIPIRWMPEKRFILQAAREYLRPIGLVYLLYGAIFVIAQSDTFLLGWLTNPDTAAEFVLLWRIPEALILLLARIPEHAQIGFIYLHRTEGSPGLGRFCSRVSFWLQALAATAALAYGLFGRWIVSLWVGNEAAPSDPWGYVLAGGAVFWLAYARLPAAFANMRGTQHIKRLTQIAGMELALKLTILLLLYQNFHEFSPMIAINAVHGLAFYYIYRRFMKVLIADTTVGHHQPRSPSGTA